MGKIFKLDKNLANQIAAWEVVERPVSVVKELVENAIDAKADFIKVEIKDGWKTQIIITDNWSWMSRDDLEICLEKYTTSKIKSLEDKKIYYSKSLDTYMKELNKLNIWPITININLQYNQESTKSILENVEKTLSDYMPKDTWC